MIDKLTSILEVEQLQHLLPFFTDQGVTDSVLKDLTDADLKELGVDKLGERKRLLAAFGKSGGGAVAASVVEGSAAQASGDAPPKTATTAAEATKDSPWVNTLGMPFVPIPRFDTRFCIWPVRVQDYEAYCTASGARFPEIPFSQDSDHPIVGVSWNEAIDFCVWLTGKERAEGKIDGSTVYRLPTDLEWSAAVGLPHEHEATPAERHLKAPGYPWGLRWPPPQNCGNYEPERQDQAGFLSAANSCRSLARSGDTGWDDREIAIMERYCRGLEMWHREWAADWPRSIDSHEFTSPIASFPPNILGIYDLGGNVWEWCMDCLDVQRDLKVLRGASFCTMFNYPSEKWSSLIGENRTIERLGYIDNVFFPFPNKVMYQSSCRWACTPNCYSCSLLGNNTGELDWDAFIDLSHRSIYPTNGFRIVVVTNL